MMVWLELCPAHVSVSVALVYCHVPRNAETDALDPLPLDELHDVQAMKAKSDAPM
jgi:hypothetical protein